MLAILTSEQLEELTGYVLPNAQAKCLRSHNIFYVEGKDGQIRTTDVWVEQAGKASANTDKFNMDF